MHRYLPHMSKGILAEVPGLQGAAAAKLAAVQSQALSHVQEHLEDLQLCVDSFRSAPAPVLPLGVIRALPGLQSIQCITQM